MYQFEHFQNVSGFPSNISQQSSQSHSKSFFLQQFHQTSESCSLYKLLQNIIPDSNNHNIPIYFSFDFAFIDFKPEDLQIFYKGVNIYSVGNSHGHSLQNLWIYFNFLISSPDFSCHCSPELMSFKVTMPFFASSGPITTTNGIPKSFAYPTCFASLLSELT